MSRIAILSPLSARLTGAMLLMQALLRQVLSNSTSPSRGKRDIHLIELENILFAGTIRRYTLVAIQDIVYERWPFGLGQSPCPFDKAHRAKSKKCRAGLKIPGLGFRVQVKHMQTVALGHELVLFER
jgi:hypothetical protein